MVRVTDTTKAAYKSDASVKEIEVRIPDANITLTNSDILFESLELKEAIEESDNLTFTGCIASSFKIECFNLVDDSLVDRGGYHGRQYRDHSALPWLHRQSDQHHA